MPVQLPSSLSIRLRFDWSMSALLIIWFFVTSLALLLVCCRCSVVLYVICVLPVVFTVLLFVFKNYPIVSTNKEAFFNGFVVGGHRGSPQHAPENSIPAFEKALVEGCQLVEFDIQLSSDGVPVLMHDDTTDRTADEHKIVAATTAKDLLALQLKNVGNLTNSTTIPSLEETVKWCSDNKMKMLFDVKDGSPEMVNHLVSLIRQKDLYSTVIVSSFNPLVPYLIKKADSRILTGFTNRRTYYALSSDEPVKIPRSEWYLNWSLEVADELMFWALRTFALPRFLGVDMLLLNHKDISKALVDEARDEGMVVVAWTVNNSTEMAHLRDVIGIPFLTDVPWKAPK